MDFYNWTTFYDEAKRAGHRLSLAGHLNYETQEIENSHVTKRLKFAKNCRLLIEFNWMKENKPYYNVHPTLVGSMCRTKLNHLPASLLEVPAGFNAVHIRLKDKHPSLIINDKWWVRSILMGYLPKAGEERILVKNGVVPLNKKAIGLLIDIGQRWRDGSFLCSSIYMAISEDTDVSIEEVIHESIKLDQEPDHIRDLGQEKIQDVFLNAMKLITTCKFISDVPDQELIEYDVLSKYRNEFETTNDKNKKLAIIDKSRRKGKIGWNIGTNEILFGIGPASNSKDYNQTDRELSYSHLRSGHIHIVRCGTGKKDIKVKYFRATVVRPDLPFKAD